MLDIEGVERIRSILTPCPQDRWGLVPAKPELSEILHSNQEKQSNYTSASTACKPKLHPGGLGLGSGHGSNQELQALPGETWK